MLDLFWILLLIALFCTCWLFTLACDRL